MKLILIILLLIISGCVAKSNLLILNYSKDNAQQKSELLNQQAQQQLLETLLRDKITQIEVINAK